METDAPSRLLADQGYAFIPKFVRSTICEFLYKYAVSSVAAGKAAVAGDAQVPGTPVLEKDPLTEALLELLLPRVELASGAPLHPTYSYLRVYKRGDVLRRHTDRPACEASLTLNLGYEAQRPWPIWLATASGARAFDLEPGDALLYHGIEVPHWRGPFEGEKAVQVFLHYVRRDGAYKEWAFDKREGLGVSPAARRVLEQLNAAS